jgi:predicted P-loop ATPase
MWATQEISAPRQCVFAGTTNQDTWIKQAAGELRRFWRVRTGSYICKDRIAEDRDQLFAEALVRYRSGFPYHLDTEESQQRSLEQSLEALSRHPWESRISNYLVGKNDVSSSEILTALHIEIRNQGRKEEMEIGDCLRALGGWERYKRRVGEQKNFWCSYFDGQDGTEGTVINLSGHSSAKLPHDVVRPGYGPT